MTYTVIDTVYDSCVPQEFIVAPAGAIAPAAPVCPTVPSGLVSRYSNEWDLALALIWIAGWNVLTVIWSKQHEPQLWSLVSMSVAIWTTAAVLMDPFNFLAASVLCVVLWCVWQFIHTMYGITYGRQTVRYPTKAQVEHTRNIVWTMAMDLAVAVFLVALRGSNKAVRLL